MTFKGLGLKRSGKGHCLKMASHPTVSKCQTQGQENSFTFRALSLKAHSKKNKIK